MLLSGLSCLPASWMECVYMCVCVHMYILMYDCTVDLEQNHSLESDGRDSN